MANLANFSLKVTSLTTAVISVLPQHKVTLVKAALTALGLHKWLLLSRVCQHLLGTLLNLARTKL